MKKRLITDKDLDKTLDKIRPSLQMDGGDVMILDWNQDSGTLTVRMLGMCSGCPMAQMTIQSGIAEAIRTDFPEVKKVIQG